MKKTRAQFDERQREHVLREQLRQIQKELGEGDDSGGRSRGAEDRHRRRRHAGGHYFRIARKELKRLQRMSEGGGEYAMLRTIWNG